MSLDDDIWLNINSAPACLSCPTVIMITPWCGMNIQYVHPWIWKPPVRLLAIIYDVKGFSVSSIIHFRSKCFRPHLIFFNNCDEFVDFWTLCYLNYAIISLIVVMDVQYLSACLNKHHTGLQTQPIKWLNTQSQLYNLVVKISLKLRGRLAVSSCWPRTSTNALPGLCANIQ